MSFEPEKVNVGIQVLVTCVCVIR